MCVWDVVGVWGGGMVITGGERRDIYEITLGGVGILVGEINLRIGETRRNKGTEFGGK